MKKKHKANFPPATPQGASLEFERSQGRTTFDIDTWQCHSAAVLAVPIFSISAID